MLTPQVYQHWLATARRYSRRAGEAEDLLHNSLLSAISAGRQNLDDPANAAWFAGVIRNLAAMDARSAVRRKNREAAHVPPAPVEEEPADELQAWLRSLSSLPRAARSVAALALHGLNRQEIASVLGLSDPALRQRLTSVRRAWSKIDPAARPTGVPQLRSTLRTKLELGLMRRSLIEVLHHEGDIGTHDPDGHLIVLTGRNSRNRLWRQL